MAVSIGQDFNSAIGETTTSGEAAVAQSATFDRLPPAGVLIEVSTPNTEVAEGSSVGVQIQGFGPDAAGATYDYVIIGSNGFGSSDLVDGSLTGSVTLDSVGNGLLQGDIKDDAVDGGESFTVQISAAPGLAVVTDPITVTDTPGPTPTLQVSSSNSAVDDGDELFFSITSSELEAGTEVAWQLNGISSADVDGAATSGTVFLDSDGTASVPFQISDEVSFDGSQSVSFTVEAAGLSASSVVVINAQIFLRLSRFLPPILTSSPTKLQLASPSSLLMKPLVRTTKSAAMLMVPFSTLVLREVSLFQISKPLVSKLSRYSLTTLR